MGLLIGAFVMLIIGVALVTVVAGQSNLVAEKTRVVQETQTVPSTCWELANASGLDVGWYDGANIPWVQINVSGYADGGCNLTVANPPTGWRLTDDDSCPLTSITVENGTEVDLTSATDYVVIASTGVIVMLNTSDTQHTVNSSNDTLVTYTYCGADYVNSGFGRTALGITIGLFAIALLMGAVGMFYQVMKNEGLTNL